MPSVTFTVMCREGNKNVRVYDVNTKADAFNDQMTVGKEETVQVFAFGNEGEIIIYCTCPQQNEDTEPCVKKRFVNNGDIIEVPGCGQRQG